MAKTRDPMAEIGVGVRELGKGLVLLSLTRSLMTRVAAPVYFAKRVIGISKYN